MKNTKLSWLVVLAMLCFITPSWALDKDTETYIQEQIELRWQEIIASDEFQKRVDEGILRFIETQNKQQAQAEQEIKQRGTQQLLPVNAERDHIRGDVNAEFTLLEYSDFECPFCKRFHKTAKKFSDSHTEVNWVYRHFPLNSHNPGAQQQSEASECVANIGGNDAFWKFTDLVYDQTRSGGRGFAVSKLAATAEKAGVSQTDFKTCFDAGKYRTRVLEDLANGQQSGITGTPGNFLIHNPSGTLVVISGAQPLENLERTLAALKKQF